MREITHKIYTFGELSEAAKETAIEECRYSFSHYAWIDEIEASAKAIGKVFGINIDFEYDAWLNCRADWRYDESRSYYLDNIIEAKGARAIAYILNQFPLKKQCYNFRNKAKNILGAKAYKANRWALAKNRYEDNMLTGYIADYCTIEAFEDFVKAMRKSPKTVTLEHFFDLVTEHFAKEAQGEIDYQNSDEGVKERIECNNYEFYADGTLYD